MYDDLSAFHAVCQAESLTDAAERLGISLQTLTRRVSSLEAQLGRPLLDHDARTLSLTDAGERAAVAARRVREAQDEARAWCRALRAGEPSSEAPVVVCVACDAGEVTRAADDAAGDARRLGVPAVGDPYAALRIGAVDVVIDLGAHARAGVTGTAPGVGGAPATRRDAASQAPTAARPALDLMGLGEIGGVIAFDRGSDLSRRGSVTIDRLADEPFEAPACGDVAGEAAWEEFRARCEEVGFEPIVRLRAARPSGARDEGRLAARGRGSVACAAGSAQARALREAGRVLVPLTGVGMEVVAVTRRGDARAAAFAREVARRLASQAGHRAIPFAATFGACPKSDVDVGVLTPERRASLLAEVLDEPKVTEDLVLPDGTVVDKAYVMLRNRLNRIGEGLGNDPVSTSYDTIMRLWSVDEARATLEMPLFTTFTAYDFAVRTGRDAGACERMLEALASRSLLMRRVRGGVVTYDLPAWHSMWEASVMHYSPEFLDLGIMGSDLGTGSQYPTYHVVAVGRDVVREGRVAPYRDWESYLRSQSVICKAPCQCRAVEEIVSAADMSPARIARVTGCVSGASIVPTPRADGDAPAPYDGGDGHCLMFGETAEYWVHIGAGTYVSTEEALELARRNVYEGGAVPELSFSRDPEIMCFCRPEYCVPLNAIRVANGHTSTMRNMSAYRLAFDASACVRCGACVARCPMRSISLAPSQDGRPALVPDDACIGCGQCVIACDAGARLLELKDDDEICDVPADATEGNVWRSIDRMARGYVSDFTGTRLEDGAQLEDGARG